MSASPIRGNRDESESLSYACCSRVLCPVCKKAVYSPADMHPQCAVAPAGPTKPKPLANRRRPSDGSSGTPITRMTGVKTMYDTPTVLLPGRDEDQGSLAERIERHLARISCAAE